MCVIFHGKAKDIRSLDLKSAWGVNPHGAGIIIPDKKPKIIKGIMNYDDLARELKGIPNKLSILVHLRMATHGEISKHNTHPFAVDSSTALMHNGILHGLGISGTKRNSMSDSKHLSLILSRLRHDDRLSLLSALSGRFALVCRDKVHLLGGFEKLHSVYMSNSHWRIRHTVGRSIVKPYSNGIYQEYDWEFSDRFTRN